MTVAVPWDILQTSSKLAAGSHRDGHECGLRADRAEAASIVVRHPVGASPALRSGSSRSHADAVDVLTVMRRPEGRTLVMDVLPASFPWVRYLPAHEMRRFSVELAADDRLSGCLRILTGMACRISELVIDCADPDRLAAFWSDVLGYVELGREDDGSIEIGPTDGGFGGPQPTLVLSPSSDPRTRKLRLHIDVNPTDRDQDAELERLLALGARPADVGQTGTESWHVLADPEGNEFCLLRTRLQPL